MSLELVTRSLQLDLADSKSTISKKGAKLKTILNTARQGIKKEKLRLQKNKQKEIIEKRKGKQIKSAIEKYKDDVQDNTVSNVEALMRLTELGKVKNNVAEKILYKQPCRLSRDIKEDNSKLETGTVFTEEDFKLFEKSYKPK